MTDVRRKIILDYARWTALSALRSGSPVKSRADVYSVLDGIPFEAVLSPGPSVTVRAFDEWHEAATHELCRRDSRIVVGWAAKLLNVYLKTAAYVGELGRDGLRDALHPPIDGGLWSGLHALADAVPTRVPPSVLGPLLKQYGTIGGITEYQTYRSIIAACRPVAQAVGCSLIELEQFWLGSATPPPGGPAA